MSGVGEGTKWKGAQGKCIEYCMELFYVVVMVVSIQWDTFIKIHQSIHLNENFIISRFYLNKADLKLI